MNHFTEKQLEEADIRLDEIRDAKVEREQKNRVPTPRTDEAWAAWPYAGSGVSVHFSRKLERELTAARAEIEEYKNAFTEMNQALGVEVEEVERLKLELTAVTERRDKLDDQLDQILIRLGDTQEKMFDAEKQRDRLIKAIEPLKYWRDISECDCSNPLPQGGCLRCDLERILKTFNESKP